MSAAWVTVNLGIAAGCWLIVDWTMGGPATRPARAFIARNLISSVAVSFVPANGPAVEYRVPVRRIDLTGAFRRPAVKLPTMAQVPRWWRAAGSAPRLVAAPSSWRPSAVSAIAGQHPAAWAEFVRTQNGWEALTIDECARVVVVRVNVPTDVGWPVEVDVSRLVR